MLKGAVLAELTHDGFHYHACLVSCLLAFLCALSEHTRNAHNHQLTAHVEKTSHENGEGTSFKSSMFRMS